MCKRHFCAERCALNAYYDKSCDEVLYNRDAADTHVGQADAALSRSGRKYRGDRQLLSRPSLGVKDGEHALRWRLPFGCRQSRPRLAKGGHAMDEITLVASVFGQCGPSATVKARIRFPLALHLKACLVVAKQSVIRRIRVCAIVASRWSLWKVLRRRRQTLYSVKRMALKPLFVPHVAHCTINLTGL